MKHKMEKKKGSERKILRSLPFFFPFYASLLCFFSFALLVTSCCCLYHLSADDETSNVLKRSVKNVCSRFGSLLYINITQTFQSLCCDVYDLFVISGIFSLALFLCTLIMHSSLVRSSRRLFRSQVFMWLGVLKECSTVQVVDDKVKALTMLVKQQDRTCRIQL